MNIGNYPLRENFSFLDMNGSNQPTPTQGMGMSQFGEDPAKKWDIEKKLREEADESERAAAVARMNEKTAEFNKSSIKSMVNMTTTIKSKNKTILDDDVNDKSNYKLQSSGKIISSKADRLALFNSMINENDKRKNDSSFTVLLIIIIVLIITGGGLFIYLIIKIKNKYI
jgi:hypothetical protein